MNRLQPHRCRWLRWEPNRDDREKGDKAQKLMCWQRGQRVRERECLPCLLSVAIGRYFRSLSARQPPRKCKANNK